MCESKAIRYVHTMTHPHYGTALKVGCVCAQNMECDYVGPRLRERKLRLIADRRKRWLTRRGWIVSARGNPFINIDGFNIAIFCHADGSWGGRIEERNTGRVFWLAQRCNTADAAKLAAFDQMMVLKNGPEVTPRAEAVPPFPIETGIAKRGQSYKPDGPLSARRRLVNISEHAAFTL
jgi:hypothetical protein